MNHSALHAKYDVDPCSYPREYDQGRRVRKLWAAVLEEAKCCVNGHVVGGHSEPHKAVEADRARIWFDSSETAPGSFLWVCGLLDVLPGKIRAAIVSSGKWRRYRA